jgi:hypothetical protein
LEFKFIQTSIKLIDKISKNCVRLGILKSLKSNYNENCLIFYLTNLQLFSLSYLQERRETVSTGVPDSHSLRIFTIWFGENLLFFIDSQN